ncbi:alpha/beta hydrolase [Dyadobacter psychrotolerans]|uniref:Alpha/beta hydrolase n=1 Tax=Dyadobacter psychrotolerans TaxID=2541721 RepID=A0A4R5DMD7_9BACT|nr:alpha/beta hydrolase [Dyadobacter psychrotolerans]TDE14657.1 alpha/beta hydrolase [Dyadobacter psychrotolerans]
MLTRLLIATLLLLCFKTFAQTRIPLYSGTIPNSIATKNQEEHTANALVDSLTGNVSIPDLSVFLPDLPNGTAVIICPGGGYGILLTKREGSDVAKAFNKLGVTAFVLKYRIPSDKTMKDRSIGPLQDAQQAIKIVRENAAKYKVDPKKIGIMGFSAGGHLAATAGTHFNKRFIDESGTISLRPDFMILINPVISFDDSIGHVGSRDNLLGNLLTEETKKYFSNELFINASTPKTFLVHSGADTVVPVANSTRFYDALNKNKVRAAMHIYAFGEHGFLTYPSFEEWFGRCVEWMKMENLIKK